MVQLIFFHEAIDLKWINFEINGSGCRAWFLKKMCGNRWFIESSSNFEGRVHVPWYRLHSRLCNALMLERLGIVTLIANHELEREYFLSLYIHIIHEERENSKGKATWWESNLNYK